MFNDDIYMNSFYWHDYETFGINPRWQRPSQFAGIRTDLDFNMIGEPLNIFCLPPTDVLPDPEACLVTGITPQQCLENGLPECEFAKRIHDEMSVPGTCSVGYNSIRFDDEFSRHLFYRNFYDPYQREWQNGNSRWDLIDVMRMVYALRPDGIEWPTYQGKEYEERGISGRNSFRLEDLSQANELNHESAHDALSDVWATVALAKKVKQAQPKLFDYALSLRNKKRVAELFDLQTNKPVFHVSSKLNWQHGYASLLMPLWKHPSNNNGIVCYDLSVDPQALFDCSSEDITHRLFTKKEELEKEGLDRVHIKTIHLNKSPMVANLSVLDEVAASRLNIDRKKCEQHWQQIRDRLPQLKQKILAALDRPFENDSDDVEFKLYGGFLSTQDKKLCDQVRQSTPQQLAETTFSFADNRLTELLFRYRARNFPDSLNELELEQWEEFRYLHLTEKLCEGYLSLDDFHAKITELQSQSETESQWTEKQHYILQRLADWADQIL